MEKQATIDTDNQQLSPDNQQPTPTATTDNYSQHSTIDTRQPTDDKKKHKNN
jgi:hypothetical protein